MPGIWPPARRFQVTSNFAWNLTGAGGQCRGTCELSEESAVRTTTQHRNTSSVIGLVLTGLALEASATAPYYDGFTAFAAPVCSSASGGSISTGTRTAVWSTPPGGATEARVDSVNGVAVFSPAAYASPAASGMTNFGSFSATGLGPYPFTYTFQFTTSVGGSLISMSSASISCVADGPGRRRSSSALRHRFSRSESDQLSERYRAVLRMVVRRTVYRDVP